MAGLVVYGDDAGCPLRPGTPLTSRKRRIPLTRVQTAVFLRQQYESHGQDGDWAGAFGDHAEVALPVLAVSDNRTRCMPSR